MLTSLLSLSLRFHFACLRQCCQFDHSLSLTVSCHNSHNHRLYSCLKNVAFLPSGPWRSYPLPTKHTNQWSRSRSQELTRDERMINNISPLKISTCDKLEPVHCLYCIAQP